MPLPDVEALAREFLTPIVSPLKVVTTVPKKRPLSFVRSYRTGGAAVNRILEEAHLTIEAEAPDGVDALKLASDCREAFLNDYSRMPLVRGAREVGGLHYSPDPDTNIPRYRFTVGLMVRAGR